MKNFYEDGRGLSSSNQNTRKKEAKAFSKEFDRNFHHLLPFDMVFSAVHEQDYDPIAVIEQFWAKNDLNDSRDHIVYMYLKSIGQASSERIKVFEEQELNKFSIELMQALLAYYMVHSHSISLDDVEIPVLPTSKISEEELKFRQITNVLFGNKKST